MNYTTMEMGGDFLFRDNLPAQLAPTGADILLSTPAHFAVDEAGLKWSTVGHYKFTSGTGGSVQMHLFTIKDDVRTLAATYQVGRFHSLEHNINKQHNKQ